MKVSKNTILITIVVVLSCALIMLATLLYRCNKTVDKPAHNPTHSSSALSRIFVPEMINADLAYLEQVTGPARVTEKNTKLYQVEGCELAVAVSGHSVEAMQLGLSKTCTFDLNKFLERKFPPVHTMTFGQFDSSVGEAGIYSASCLIGCGNAVDPVVFEIWSGSRSEGLLEFALGVVLAREPVLGSAEKWEKAMVTGEGEEWVSERLFMCFPKYNDIAQKAFKNVNIDYIAIGQNLKGYIGLGYYFEKPICKHKASTGN